MGFSSPYICSSTWYPHNLELFPPSMRKIKKCSGQSEGGTLNGATFILHRFVFLTRVESSFHTGYENEEPLE